MYFNSLFVVKLIQGSLRHGGTFNFLICTDSLSSLHCLLSVYSTEKLVVEVQSILYYLDCDIRENSGNLGNDRADQLAKEATCQDMNIFNVCVIAPLEACILRKNFFLLEYRILVLA
ncbi:RNase H domain-containing protein [Trichonephila clavipes]|nr:RNase H domain-containing protein [Trichonephila clavipes]